MPHSDAREWIEHEDALARADRIARLEWLTANYPLSDLGFMLNGGWLSHRLLEEARYCFAYGQFLATSILGVAFIERVLAARFYAAGRDDLERAGGHDLLREALKSAWISQDEFEQFDKLRRLRNPLVHFKRPLARDTMEYRVVEGEAYPDELAKGDAQDILQSVFHVLQKSAV